MLTERRWQALGTGLLFLITLPFCSVAQASTEQAHEMFVRFNVRVKCHPECEVNWSNDCAPFESSRVD